MLINYYTIHLIKFPNAASVSIKSIEFYKVSIIS